jgi:hypothetical protein
MVFLEIGVGLSGGSVHEPLQDNNGFSNLQEKAVWQGAEPFCTYRTPRARS